MQPTPSAAAGKASEIVTQPIDCAAVRRGPGISVEVLRRLLGAAGYDEVEIRVRRST